MEKKPRENNAGKSTPRRKWPLSQIYFYLTEGCNLRCRHCWLAPKHEDPANVRHACLDFGLFRQIVAEARPLGLGSVKLTGGEPLMHPQIGSIIELLRDEQIPFNMETNGTLLTPSIAKQLAEAGCTLVSVSVDGIEPETHEWVRGVDGSFDATLRGIKNLVAAEIRPQIILSVMRKTRPQMEAFVEWARDLGAGSVKFNIVQPTERGRQLAESGNTLSVAELVETGKWVERELTSKSGIRVFYHHPAVFRPLGSMFSREECDGGCCGIKGILGVLGNGSYALCGIGMSVPELVFGQAGKDQLAKVWRYNKTLRAIRAGLPEKLEGVCSRCLLKRYCLGSCIAQNYYTSKSLWAPFWYCEEAHRLGLFPQERLYPTVN